MMNYIKINQKDRIKEQLDVLGNRLMAFWNFDQHDLVIEYRPHVDKATRSQQNLYWMWLGEMASHVNEHTSGSEVYDAEDMHDRMRHQFLGYCDKVVGTVTIGHQLRSTAKGKIDKEDMSNYMRQIEVYAHDSLGLMLTIPHANEYMKYREALT